MRYFFIPRKGDLFYVKVQPVTLDKEVVGVSGISEVTKVTRQDSSYSDQIFRCVASDDTSIVCLCVVGGSKYSAPEPQIFRLGNGKYKFEPVGPEVQKYFKLNTDTETI